MTMGRLIVAAMLVGPALAGCTANDPTFGGAVRSNYAVQVINPEPRYEGALAEGGDGARSAAAIERYRTDKVKKPESIRSTQRSSGSSGGN
jgi:type IV pilus biogenesis protein CpaD/CtpE